MTTSLKPPGPETTSLICSVFQLLLSAYLENILYKSPTNIAASSPPAPALSSKNEFRESSLSLGKS